jgi:hypothetical protein
LPWLLARRKKKLRPLRLLRLLRPLLRPLRLLRLLTPPLLRPLRLLLTLLLRPLRLPLRLLRLLLTLLLLPLLRLLRSNQLRAIETGLRAGFFSSIFLEWTVTHPSAIKKPATKAGFFEQADDYFSSSASSFRILAPVGDVSGLPSLVWTVTSLVVAFGTAETSTR